jgi:hypothetical protein
MTSENWRPVVGCEGYYSVSDLGRVRGEDRTYTYNGRHGLTTRSKRGKVLTQHRDTVGYKTVTLSMNAARKKFRVHRLVLEAFVGLRPDGMVCRHLNDDKTNNTLANLTWGSYLENSADAIRNGNPNQHTNKTHCFRGHPFSPENTCVSTERSGKKNGRHTDE